MVRLVFRLYTQICPAICTSESLRASTRMSSGFALHRHSSPSEEHRQPGLLHQCAQGRRADHRILTLRRFLTINITIPCIQHLRRTPRTLSRITVNNSSRVCRGPDGTPTSSDSSAVAEVTSTAMYTYYSTRGFKYAPKWKPEG